MIELKELNPVTVLLANAGDKFIVVNPATGLKEIVRCHEIHLEGRKYFFTRNSCPEAATPDEKGNYAPYEEVFQHIRPIDETKAVSTLAEFASMLETGRYRIA